MSDQEALSNRSSLLFYQTEDGKQRIEVRLEEETVWLTQRQMSELFQTTPENITIHIKNIFSEGEGILSNCPRWEKLSDKVVSIGSHYRSWLSNPIKPRHSI